MRRSWRRVRGTLVAAVVGAGSMALAPPSSGHRAQPGRYVEIATIGSIAAQLGVKPVFAVRVDDEFTIGVQFTGLLVDPEKLAAFGVKGMHAGARVVAARVAPDRVYIEADEMEPPRRASTRVTLGENGKLVRPPNT